MNQICVVYIGNKQKGWNTQQKIDFEAAHINNNFRLFSLITDHEQ